MKSMIKNMKLYVAMAAALLMVACQSEDKMYEGKNYVMFSDSIYTMPVMVDNQEFEVPVAAMTTASYDRNYAVEILHEKSTAVRGVHFDFVEGSNNITIKAGERVGMVRIKPIYSHMERNDSLVISLRLLEPAEEQLAIYGNTTRIDMVKCYPFDMNDFIFPGGNMYMLASFPFSSDTQQIRVNGEVKDDHTFILKDAFSNIYPLRLEFDDSDPLDYTIRVPEQPAFKDSNYGTVYVRSVDMYPSYFVVPDHFFVLYLEVYIPQLGSFGVYQYIFKCITQNEADDMDNGAA